MELPIDDPATWTAWATAGTMVVLAVSGIIAFVQLGQARKLRKEQTRPYVILDFESQQSLLDLVIQNIGSTPASDVEFGFDPKIASSFDGSGRPDRADWFILKEGIPFLPPGREYRLLLDVGHQRAKTDLPNRYEVRVTYRDRAGKRFSERQVLDMSPFWGMEHVNRKSIHDIAKELEELSKAVSSIEKRLK